LKLRWSEFASADREGIFDYLVERNPGAALMVDERIEESIERLLQFPEIGRTGRVSGTRELVISDTPYIAAYRIKDQEITVLRVLHGARLWPDEISAT
jgi:toxin ParE1/3/4